MWITLFEMFFLFLFSNFFFLYLFAEEATVMLGRENIFDHFIIEVLHFFWFAFIYEEIIAELEQTPDIVLLNL